MSNLIKKIKKQMNGGTGRLPKILHNARYRPCKNMFFLSLLCNMCSHQGNTSLNTGHAMQLPEECEVRCSNVGQLSVMSRLKGILKPYDDLEK